MTYLLGPGPLLAKSFGHRRHIKYGELLDLGLGRGMRADALRVANTLIGLVHIRTAYTTLILIPSLVVKKRWLVLYTRICSPMCVVECSYLPYRSCSLGCSLPLSVLLIWNISAMAPS